MSRSITVVNTSNWAGEDYVLRTRSKHARQHAEESGGKMPPWNEKTLKPGEMEKVYPEQQDFEFEPVTDKEAPFRLEGGEGRTKQVFPNVVAFVGTAPNVEMG